MPSGTTRSSDGTQLATYSWSPEGEAIGQIVLVHGVGEHMGRYEHVAQALVAAGYAVRAVDFRGHGHSEGRRGHVDRWERYVEDLRAAVALQPGPYAIVAHSMGTMVSLDHLRDAHAWGYVGSATTVGIGVKAPQWKLKAAGFLSKVWPTLKQSNEIPASHICSDPAVVKTYLADPLVFSTITPRWFIEVLAVQERIRAAAAHYDTPALVLYGEDDQIISIPDLVDFCSRYKAEMTVVSYPNMRHEVLNEFGQAEVIETLINWLNEHNPSDP